MKTPEEILLDVWEKTGVEKGWDTIAIEAMKEFGRQAWMYGRYDIHEKHDSYGDWLQSLYLNQIAKDSQERGEYEAKPEECEHKRPYQFHDNAPRYCPDCEKYIE